MHHVSYTSEEMHCFPYFPEFAPREGTVTFC